MVDFTLPYETWVRALGAFDVVSLLDFEGEGGLVKGDKLMNKLGELLGGDKAIEQLPVKFTVVASDIDEEKEVWLQNGSLLEAIRASISILIFFDLYKLRGRLLVDGGVLSPVPISPTFGDHTDLSVAVNLGGETSRQNLLRNPTTSETQLVKRIKNSITSLTLKNSLLQSATLQVANSSFDTIQANLSHVKLAAYPPDIEITIPRDLCGTLEFNRANEIINYGYNIAKEQS